MGTPEERFKQSLGDAREKLRSFHDPHQLARELRGNRCRCGRRKGRGKTFCGPCFYSLSKSQQRALYGLFGRGYEEAYSDAVATLKAKEGK